MGYCHDCGTYADLDTCKKCPACRVTWQPNGPRPGDLGYRDQPQPPGPA